VTIAMRETEQRHAATVGLDLLETDDVVQVLIAVHADVPALVALAAPATVLAVDGAAARLRAGGRLVYVGSGTPGALVESDAAELPPTFGFPPERLAIVRARSARVTSSGPDEDAPERGGEAIGALKLTPADVVVAVASSGSTPYTLGAARRAARDGAFLIAVVNVRDAALADLADVAIVLRTGAEPVMGSTRMRAGLSQRLWLTVFSTAVMVRLGLTHDNLMVNVAPQLAKLRERRLTVLAEASGLDRAAATAALDAAGDDLRVALVMVLADAGRERAAAALERGGGRVREAVELLRS
jgi:N-acetylmuramic acid 6-phosphate etherase